MKHAIVVLAMAAALGGCGQRSTLRPAEGKALPPKPLSAPRAATVDELLVPPTQTRPERRDDVVRRSEPRRDDRFDLPPPG